MKQDFLDRHIHQFLLIYTSSNKPLDLLLSHYFKEHKNLGSTDRKIIGDTVYGMVRWKSLLDFFHPEDPLSFYRNINWDAIQQDPSIPNFARCGLNEFLYHRFSTQFGSEKALNLGQLLNQTAPTTIRVNLLKVTRDHLLSLWKDRFSISACTHAPNGIQFEKREPLFSLPEFKQGFFEMQDEGSQLVANAVLAKPQDLVLDYCSGSGGKTLAFAPAMQGKGQIFLHDIRNAALAQARLRLRRAGIQNAQCLAPNHPQLSRLKRKCDWVLIDVPCTGTGTLRRNPDQKWKIDAVILKHLIQQQRQIALEAIQYVKPGGRLVYATCSLLVEENQMQVDFFLKTLPLTLETDPLSLLPVPQGMDGFFCSTFKVQ